MDDFTFFTPEDRKDISYGACVGGTTVLWAAVGRFGMLPGLLVGAATGLAVGLITCRKISPVLERKIFSSEERFTDPELLGILKVVSDETGVRSKADAMYLFSQARLAAVTGGQTILSGNGTCQPTRVAAAQLMSRRT